MNNRYTLLCIITFLCLCQCFTISFEGVRTTNWRKKKSEKKAMYVALFFLLQIIHLRFVVTKWQKSAAPKSDHLISCIAKFVWLCIFLLIQIVHVYVKSFHSIKKKINVSLSEVINGISADIPIAVTFSLGPPPSICVFCRDLYAFPAARQRAVDTFLAERHNMHPITANMVAKDLEVQWSHHS